MTERCAGESPQLLDQGFVGLPKHDVHQLAGLMGSARLEM